MGYILLQPYSIIAPYESLTEVTAGNLYYRTLTTSEQISCIEEILSRIFCPSNFQVSDMFVATYEGLQGSGVYPPSLVSHPLFLIK